jgi:hypothetical protein
MLTIENINKILHKTLGKKNFYVERVEQKFDFGHTGYNLTTNNKYVFEISNYEFAMAVFLDRTPVELHNENCYRLYDAGNGLPIYLTIGEIKNMDKFLDKIRLVALG